ncbi:imidazole glycerol phosphate synthase subunit HisH [Pseudoxanthomonas sp. SL93]|uniref:imidazole glycerol phosphate synthase subunit HisH n=1 Tax=Pseudoxanthomonas sp. SL93 TaxID=2995142 RepID=UPI00226FFC26|nr:imidazole glycerol phosphate synthase subunit HisH [Pseudoxanthomonas sp. SL93]WAC64906.1 imidazole glycerol phosphate synthase subunit HisH [Pseudoxanthomonas sp. SL93]
MMRVAMIDAGGANLGSVRYALNRLGVEPELTTDADAIRAADRVILPGVSTAAQVMGGLREWALVEVLRTLEKPLLGVCVGMQLLFEHSEEDDTPCLGLVPGRVAKLPVTPGIRVPHMGWNTLVRQRESVLTRDVDDGRHAYFVHSYAAPVTVDCVASSEHGVPFAAIVQRGNVGGAQFHPERSADVGARLLENFLKYGVQ